MRPTSHTSSPTPRIIYSASRTWRLGSLRLGSARAAGVARRGVAGRGLQLGEGLPALGEQIPLVDRLIDEVPRQERVERIGPVHEAVGTECTQRLPPRVRTGVKREQDVRRPTVAAREK